MVFIMGLMHMETLLPLPDKIGDAAWCDLSATA